MKRIVEPEFLDALPPDDPRAIRSRRDLRRVNSCMGNVSTMVRALQNNLRGPLKEITELGAGDGNFLLQVAKKLKVPDINATLLDFEKNVSAETVAAFSKLGWRADLMVVDVFDWPQTQAEIVIANLFLHHFENARLTELLWKISRRTRLFVTLEPRRAFLPLFFCRWLWAIGCNSITKHDAAVSVRAGFSNLELSALWPDQKNWRLTECRAGLCSHLFIAQKIS